MLFYQSGNSIKSSHYHYDLYDDFKYVSHFHQFFEVIYVLEGDVICTVEGQNEIVSKNEMAFILPNQIHSYNTPSKSKVWVALFSNDLVSRFSNEIYYKTSNKFTFSCDEITGEYIFNCLLNQNNSNLYSLKSFLYAICGEYYNKMHFTEKKDSLNDKSIHKIMEYISLHFSEDISLKHLARHIGYNSNYLSRFFNRTLNMGFKQFINEYRIEYAKNLLMADNINISEVAMECGFGSIRNFNRTFMEITSLTPTDFRISQK